MAESLEEFVNGSQTLATLTSGLAIVTNTGAQRALVKDIQIANTSAVPLNLSVGATTLFSGVTDTSLWLSGSEIIGASSALTLQQASVYALFNKIQSFRTGQSSVITAKTHFTGIALPTQVAAVAQTTITSALTVTPAFAFISAAGDLYYHSNAAATPTLYKRAGGINGTQTTVASFGSCVWGDGVRYIYGLTGTNTLKTLDTTTDIVTTATLSPVLTATVDTTYSHGAAMDGYCWVRSTYSDEGNLINAATGAVQKGATVGFGRQSGTTSRQFVAMGKNTAGDYILIQMDTNLYWWNIGPTLSSAVVKASGNFTNPFPATITGNANLLFRATHIDNQILYIPTNTTHKFMALDLTTMTAVGQTLTGPTSTDLSNCFALAYDASLATADAPSVTVRATGVKIS